MSPLVALAVSSCGGDAAPAPTDGGATSDASSCVPDRALWTSTVRAQVERQCGSCHGATPNYGAPFSLLDYDANLAGRVGMRHVDRIAARLMAGTMPPSGTPAPPDDIARSIVQWASCGAQTPTPGTGLRASAPLFRSPEMAPAGMASFELRADNFTVNRALTERYQCYAFNVPVMAARFARRFEIILDHPEVVHHVVLLRDPDRTSPSDAFECQSMSNGVQFLYAWAPGQNALQFPEGGLRMTPGDRFVLQLHYNNSAGRDGFTDRSGVRIYHDVPTGTEYGMVAMGPTTFSIPPRSTASVESACTVAQGSRLLTGMPHMHGIGTGFSQRVLRAGGTMDPVLTLQGWGFDTQLFYDTPVTFGAGDRIVTRCDFNNTRDTVTRSGAHTTDEMCFNFAYVTPAPASRFCDEVVNPSTATGYRPGMCAVAGGPTDAPLVTGSIIVGDPPASTGGTIPTGHWELQNIAYHLSSATTAAGAVDLAMSGIRARGHAWVEANRITVDLNTTLNLVLGGGVSFAREIPLSFASTFPTMTTPLALTTACPPGATMGVPTMLNYSVTGDTLVTGPAGQMVAGVTITPRFTFRRVP
jgi:Copper type II ascorbate-dependent monooxygenase, C-terminal domain/Copper type II ascorbate-dependent monooxygenase, N-terminal domain